MIRDMIRNSFWRVILYYMLQEYSPKRIADHIADHMTVYLCYSERDKEYGSFAARSLGEMGFRVYD
jgi:hypothetical protein